MATANVLRSLGAVEARDALDDVLAQGPDLVGLQEWGLARLRLLRETGTTQLLIPGIPRQGADHSRGRPLVADYHWAVPLLGGCPVGLRTGRFTLTSCRTVTLSRVGRGDKPDRLLGIEPPRIATLAVFRDLRGDRPVSFLNYHLVPAVQARGKYREDRPLLVARHRSEVVRLQRVIDRQLARGHEVYAVGDSNFDGLRFSGLTSAWEGREDQPGTLGPHRKIDDVHGPGLPTRVTALTNDSDHKALVVSRER